MLTCTASLPSLAACTHFLASQPSYHSTHAQPALSGEWLLLLLLALSASAQAASDLVSTSPRLPLAHRQAPQNTFLKPYLGHNSSLPSLCVILPTHSNSVLPDAAQMLTLEALWSSLAIEDA